MPTTPYTLCAPRDARSPVVERLEWATDVQVARSGAERRTQLRPYPRHTVSFDVALHTPLAREAMPAIREGALFVVPLWQHVFERGQGAPDAGLVAGLESCLALDHRGRGEQLGTPLSWPEWADVAAPAALARPVGDSRAITHVVRRVGTSSLSFQLIDHREAVGPYDGPTAGGLPLLDVFTETAQGIAESSAISSNFFDTGLIDGLSEIRHVKKGFSLSLTLGSRAQILAFRRLLFSLQGRLKALAWTPPYDEETLGTFRLAADGVELSYLRPGLATCTLSLTRVSA